MDLSDRGFVKQNSAHMLTVKESIYRNALHIPLFLISLTFCIVSGIFYTQYATPKYNVSALILVKGEEKGTYLTSADSEDLIATVLNGETKFNLENEIQLIRSTGIMRKVVEKNHFNIGYYKIGALHNSDVYLDAPFRLVGQDKDEPNTSIEINVNRFTNEGVVISYSSKPNKVLNVKWFAPFTVNGKRFVLVPGSGMPKPTDSYQVIWERVEKTTDEILDNLAVDILDKKTTIIQLEILVENIKKGEDILNALSKEYITKHVDEQKLVSQNAMYFIDNRLKIVSQELVGVEQNLESYRDNNNIINVESQSAQSFENSNTISKNIATLEIQLGVIDMIQNYFDKTAIDDNLVPSDLGINDATLAALIARYNMLQLEKQRQTPLLSKNSIILRDLNNQINNVKSSVQENLIIIKKNLKLQEIGLQKKNFQYREFLSALPHKERVMQEIKRKQSITEGLYLYLLQKREEAAIIASSTGVSNYQQIDSARGRAMPIEPRPRIIRIFSILVGILLPIGWLKVRTIIDDRVSSISDVSRHISVPIAGEIGHLSNCHSPNIGVLESESLAEQFRTIRTNLFYSQKNINQKIVLVTSTLSGEGKSFISINFAAILAMSGKKVALLDFNFKQPTVVNDLHQKSQKGLSNFLNGDLHSIAEIYFVSGDFPTMHVFAAGNVLANSGDLLIQGNLPKLFNLLKEHYDFIIIDSTPIGVVSDTLILNQQCDTVLFAVRNRVTRLENLGILNNVLLTGKLSNVSIIFNDVI